MRAHNRIMNNDFVVSLQKSTITRGTATNKINTDFRTMVQ